MLLIILSGIIYIFIIITIFRLYKDTEINPFQINFGFEEKKNFFRYNINYDAYMTEKEKKCKINQDLIMDPSTNKLGDVFELNFSKIHFYCFLILIATIFSLFSELFIKVSDLFSHIYPQKSIPALKDLNSLFNIISGCSILLSFLLLIPLFKYYLKGEIDEYYEFLTCKNVIYDAFERYRSAENLRHDLRKFGFLFIILIIIAGLGGEMDKRLKNRREMENNI